MRVLRRDPRMKAGGVARVKWLKKQIAERLAEIRAKPILHGANAVARLRDFLQRPRREVAAEIAQMILQRIRREQIFCAEIDGRHAFMPVQVNMLADKPARHGVCAEHPMPAAEFEPVGFAVGGRVMQDRGAMRAHVI